MFYKEPLFTKQWDATILKTASTCWKTLSENEARLFLSPPTNFMALRRLRRAPGGGSLCLCLHFEAEQQWCSVNVFVCVSMYADVCSLVWLCADSCLSLFRRLIGCLCLCVLVCFLAFCSLVLCIFYVLGIFFVLFLFGGARDSIVTLGSPLCHPW